MPWSSNATFLVSLGDTGGQAIYKPVRGERPLWDFEPGLHRREVAAYLLSEAMGFGVVPPTVLREDGPLGEGSLQWFVAADHREHYFTIAEQRPELHPQLRDIAVLDVVANNTDRKSGHCLLAGDRVWAIDNGLCFAPEFKLRTVIWEFAGETLTPRSWMRRRGCAAPCRPRSHRSSTRSRSRRCSGGPGSSSSRACCRATRAADATRGRWSDERAGARRCARRADPSRRPRRARPPRGRLLCEPRLAAPAPPARRRPARRRDRPPAVAGGDAGRVPVGAARSGAVGGRRAR